LDELDELFKLNRSKMKQIHDQAVAYLQNAGIECYDKCSGGFFLWINLTSRMNPELPKEQEEERIWMELIDRGVLISPASGAFHALETGWFRIVFTLDWDILKLGLDRIIRNE
jgi:aspartate/methionine/tyrosine aminotransferase